MRENETTGGAGMAILLVEDHQRVREVLTSSLQARLGADVVAAGTVADALGEIDTRRFDAILLDVNLPHVSGLEALPALRSRAPGTRIVLMSAATGSTAMADRALEAGADAFVEKSASLDLLCQALVPRLQ